MRGIGRGDRAVVTLETVGGTIDVSLDLVCEGHSVGEVLHDADALIGGKRQSYDWLLRLVHLNRRRQLTNCVAGRKKSEKRKGWADVPHSKPPVGRDERIIVRGCAWL